MPLAAGSNTPDEPIHSDDASYVDGVALYITDGAPLELIRVSRIVDVMYVVVNSVLFHVTVEFASVAFGIHVEGML